MTRAVARSSKTWERKTGQSTAFPAADVQEPGVHGVHVERTAPVAPTALQRFRPRARGMPPFNPAGLPDRRQRGPEIDAEEAQTAPVREIAGFDGFPIREINERFILRRHRLIEFPCLEPPEFGGIPGRLPRFQFQIAFRLDRAETGIRGLSCRPVHRIGVRPRFMALDVEPRFAVAFQKRPEHGRMTKYRDADQPTIPGGTGRAHTLPQRPLAFLQRSCFIDDREIAPYRMPGSLIRRETLNVPVRTDHASGHRTREASNRGDAGCVAKSPSPGA